MSTENERAYVFTHDGIQKFLQDRNLELSSPKNIEDFYIDENTRVRNVNDTFILTKKTGLKQSGFRKEEETTISSEAFNILKKLHKIRVSKTRFKIMEHENFKITCDLITFPMKLAILEIESMSPDHVVTELTVNEIFDAHLTECPLSSFNLFKRRIGICGGPSSGKSSTAQYFTNLLNTRFNANAFHVVEYATSFIQKYERTPEIYDQFYIWHGQREREIKASKANIVISDCPTFLSYVYMLIANKPSIQNKLALHYSKIYKRSMFDVCELYTDIIFLKMQNYVDNNIRFQSKNDALYIENRIKQFLDEHNVKHIETNYFENNKTLRNLFYINGDELI